MAKLAKQEDVFEEDAAEAAPLGERVLVRLRADILTMKRAPGEQMSERVLESEYGASRTPIRQALMELIREGLVWKEDRGYRVAPFDVDELSSIFEYRGIVEEAAIRLACERATPAEIAALQETVDKGLTAFTPNGWFEIGLDVHVQLAALSGNTFLRDAVAETVNRTQRARWLLAGSAELRAIAYREHCEILDLIRRRQPDAAAEAVRRHGEDVHNHIRQALEDARRVMGVRGFADTGAEEGLRPKRAGGA